jgi:hypothetical protein
MIRTHRLEGKIVETVYTQRVSAGEATTSLPEIARHLRDTPKLDWLIDMSPAISIEAAPLSLVKEIISTFKMGGGDRIAAVIPQSALRMLASALGLSTDVRVRFFERRQLALDYLRKPSSFSSMSLPPPPRTEKR